MLSCKFGWNKYIKDEDHYNEGGRCGSDLWCILEKSEQ